MLEILLLIYLCRRIGARLQKKGRPSGWFKFFVAVAWFGGIINGPNQEPSLLPAYLSALAGAALSTAFWPRSYQTSGHMAALHAPRTVRELNCYLHARAARGVLLALQTIAHLKRYLPLCGREIGAALPTAGR
jgi:hypothetical protein